MEPSSMSRNRLAAERWLDEERSFSSEAVARAHAATQMTTASDRVPKSSDVRGGFHPSLRQARPRRQEPLHARVRSRGAPCLGASAHSRALARMGIENDRNVRRAKTRLGGSADRADRLGNTESVTSRRFIAPRTFTQSASRG